MRDNEKLQRFLRAANGELAATALSGMVDIRSCLPWSWLLCMGMANFSRRCKFKCG